jgi:excisionase family DNA binding protein
VIVGQIEISPETIEILVVRVAETVLAQLPIELLVPTSPFMTIPEAAEYLRCKRQRIDDLLSERKLTRFKDGSRTLVSRAEIEGYITSNITSTATGPIAPVLPTTPRTRS